MFVGAEALAAFSNVRFQGRTASDVQLGRSLLAISDGIGGSDWTSLEVPP